MTGQPQSVWRIDLNVKPTISPCIVSCISLVEQSRDSKKKDLNNGQIKEPKYIDFQRAFNFCGTKKITSFTNHTYLKDEVILTATAFKVTVSGGGGGPLVLYHTEYLACHPPNPPPHPFKQVF